MDPSPQGLACAVMLAAQVGSGIFVYPWRLTRRIEAAHLQHTLPGRRPH
jgi:hypothetical protein